MSSDRNLLFGILALQLNFIGRDALIAAMNAWVLNKDQPLGQILRAQGQLTEGQWKVLDDVLAEQLKAHHNDPQESLATLATGAPPWLKDGLAPDADVLASLARVGMATDPHQGRGEARPSSNSCRYQVRREYARG